MTGGVVLDRHRPTGQLLWPRAMFILIAVAITQLALFDQVLLFGALRVELPLLLVVAVSLRARGDDAALFGFGAGVLVDLFEVGPFGLHALAYCLIAVAVAAGTGRRAARLTIGRTVTGRLGEVRVATAAWYSLTAGSAVVASALIVVSALAVVTSEGWASMAGLDELLEPGAIAGSAVLIHPVLSAVRGLGLVRTRPVTRSWRPGGWASAAASRPLSPDRLPLRHDGRGSV